MKRPPPVLHIPDDEIRIEAVRAQGAGGQNVNKVSNAAHLRFDVRASSLADDVKARLLASGDQRISSDGVVVIKAQRYRSLEQNKVDAVARLSEMVARVAEPAKPRRPTKPSAASKARRVEAKSRRGRIKALRGRVVDG